MEAAPDANDPLCADVTVRLPQTIDDMKKRTTNAQATGAWGNPADVLLYCGIKPSGPTTLKCVTVDGVDWIVDDSRDPIYRFEAYGRHPGLEVIVNSANNVSGTNVLTALSSSVSKLPQEGKCSSIDEMVDKGAFSQGSDGEAKPPAPSEEAPSDADSSSAAEGSATQ